jgi:hypothetical protein
MAEEQNDFTVKEGNAKWNYNESVWNASPNSNKSTLQIKRASNKKMQTLKKNINFKLSPMYKSSHFIQYPLLVRSVNMSACNMVDLLSSVYYWAWNVWKWQLLLLSHGLYSFFWQIYQLAVIWNLMKNFRRENMIFCVGIV